MHFMVLMVVVVERKVIVMKDIEKLIQHILKKALVSFAKETGCGMIDLFEDNLLYDIDGVTYKIEVHEVDNYE